MVISTPSVAYAFAKLKWPGRNIAFIIVLSTMMLPFQVQIIPLYVTFKAIGWIGTILPLVVPNFFSNALYIFLMRQFMIGIPDAICESAFIDGAGHFTILTRIVVPFCLPAIFAVGLFTFMGSWTDFFGPLIFLSNENTYTLSVGLQQFSSVHHTQWNYLMAASVMFTLPVLTLFFFTQRFFLQGITFSGVKG
jgi:multiple sugar transport system permease protein